MLERNAFTNSTPVSGCEKGARIRKKEGEMAKRDGAATVENGKRSEGAREGGGVAI